MDAFKIQVGGEEYLVEPCLHPNFYSVSSGNKSGMLGQDANGNWEMSLQGSEAPDLPVREIGEEIERYLDRI